MTKNVKIDVQYVTRVEGHGNIIIDVKNGQLVDCKLQIIEPPRFFEAMVRGRKFGDIPLITSRICGICAVSHNTVANRSVENAIGVVPSKQTELLRKILFHGEMIQSHILHVYFLVAPDFLKVGSVIPLASTHPDIVKRALRLKKLGNHICEVLAGRHIHPIASVVGGFTKIPSKKELAELKKEIEKHLPDFEATIELCKTLKIPSFERRTEYVALYKDDEYAFIDGVIKSSDGDKLNLKDYKKKAAEYIVKHSAAKHTKGNRDSYMVGALARVNNNFSQLSPLAKEVAKQLGLKTPCYNPYMNSIAQVVECAHCYEDIIRLLDIAIDTAKDEEITFTPKAGTGVGAVEAPRGILFHEYTFDDAGVCTAANCIIPTGQNLENIDLDMRKLVPEIIDLPQDEIRLMLEMLVRAYDPCISCATHFLDVKFV